eukprot:g10815.t1
MLLTILFLSVALARRKYKSIDEIPQEEQEKLIRTWNEGRAFFAEGKYMLAAKKFSSFNAVVPTPDGYGNWATSLEKAGDFEASAAVYRTMMEVYPQDAKGYHMFCRACSNILNQRLIMPIDMDEFWRVCKKGLDLAPDDTEHLSLLGSIYILLSRFDEGQDMIQRVIDIKGPQENDVSNLALGLLRMGDWLGAIEWSKKMEGFFPNSSAARRLSLAVHTITDPRSDSTVALFREEAEALAQSFQIKDKSCYKGNWTLVRNASDSKHPGLEATLLNPHSAYQLYGNSTRVSYAKRLRGPEGSGAGGTAEEPRHTYHERSIWLLKWKSKVARGDVYISGQAGVLMENCRLYEISPDHMQDLPGPSDHWHFKRSLQVDEPVASVLSHKLGNYYHWLLEATPKLIWLREHLLKERPEIGILIPTKKEHVMEEVLTLLEIPEEHFIPYPDQTHLRVRFTQDFYRVEWEAPAQDTMGTLVNDVWSGVYPPREAVLLVRRTLMDKLSLSFATPTRKADHTACDPEQADSESCPEQGAIEAQQAEETHKGDEAENSWARFQRSVLFVKREAGKNVRSITNEAEVIEALRVALSRLPNNQNGNIDTNASQAGQAGVFKDASATLAGPGPGTYELLLHSGKETFAEQAKLFSRAKVIVASHGAGLANLVFAHPAAHVVLLPMFPDTDRTFLHLCAALDLQLTIVEDVSSYYYGNFGSLSRDQVDLLVNTTVEALQQS